MGKENKYDLKLAEPSLTQTEKEDPLLLDDMGGYRREVLRVVTGS